MTKRSKIVEFLKENSKYGFTTKAITKKLKVTRGDVWHTVFLNKDKIGAYKVNKSVYYIYEQV